MGFEQTGIKYRPGDAQQEAVAEPDGLQDLCPERIGVAGSLKDSHRQGFSKTFLEKNPIAHGGR